MLPLTCPVCQKPLIRNEGSFHCEKKHSFDCAKSGYVNLLDNTKKKTKFPGDNKLMAAARRDFLNRGYYAPLSDLLNETAARLLAGKSSPAVLDAGCGEGYYTARLYSFLSKKGFSPEIFGIDISKFTVDIAAKRCRDIQFAVASAFHLPVQDASFDLAVNFFAPYTGDETRRILKKNGLFLMAIPDEDHLWELKEAVYETPYKNEVKDYALKGFNFLEAQNIRTTLDLPCSDDILNLFKMTPYYYKTSREDQQRLERLESLSVTAAFRLLAYRKVD